MGDRIRDRTTVPLDAGADTRRTASGASLASACTCAKAQTVLGSGTAVALGTVSTGHGFPIPAGAMAWPSGSGRTTSINHGCARSPAPSSD